MKTLIQHILSKKRKVSEKVAAFQKRRPLYQDFDTNFLQTRALFLNEFKQLPNEYFIADVDREKVLTLIHDIYQSLILEEYKKAYYVHHKNNHEVSHLVMILSNEVILDIGDDYVELQYGYEAQSFVDEFIDVVKTFKAESKDEPTEINIITLKAGRLDLKAIDIKPTELDLNL